jgi:DNA-binding transcriptional ArsR family regulator
LITVRLTAEDLSRVRFAFSPLWETVASFRALLNPARHALHLPWIEETRGAIGKLDLAPLYALVLPEGYIPDFLVPPPTTPLPSFEDEMERLEQTAAATVLEEVGLLRGDYRGGMPGGRDRLLGAYLEDPEDFLRRLVATVSRYHEIAIAPHWPRLRALLEADVLKRAQALAFGGPEALFRELHPSVRYREGLVEVEKDFQAELESGGRGILLVPCVFAWPDLYAVIEAPWQPSLVYTPRGAARLWVASPAGAGEAMAAALGPGRASILRELSVPRTTTELARQLGLSPGTASEHLSRLRKARLVEPHRVGRNVFYRLSYEGEQLLLIFGEQQ